MTLSASPLPAPKTNLKNVKWTQQAESQKSGGNGYVVVPIHGGGIDTGAIGRNGSKEKHVVLAIAKRPFHFAQSWD